MTALTVIGATAGLLVLVLMALAPVLVELNERHPVQPRKQPVRTEARPQKPVRVSAVLTTH
ncbi:hypothetical protein ATK30_5062 [Amycolatopsis echigonensis]|uniref:Uncharacterized protein n=1 Tax=Amycolatopsis echigonensis TaxID=2576905 RepID=A0A2N3WJY8_9PSEU|nr:hypothetical protein [Amycolatopsis niigatensis]PKV94189.1 hypothetical protein ATK30_5062 [Amycolatopsis niigatensis]